MAQGLKDRLLEALTRRGVVSPEGLTKALEVQRTRGGSVSDILTGMGLVEPQVLLSVLSQELQIPPINLSKIRLDQKLVKVIPKKLALYYQIVPVSLMGQTLTVAMADPLNILALDDLTAATGFVLTPLMATREQVQAAIHEMYLTDVSQAVQELVAPPAGGGQDFSIEVVDLGLAPSRQADELVRLTQETPVVRMTETILQQGVALRASDVLLEPFEHQMRVRYRVDGSIQEAESPPWAMHEGIISRIKIMSGLDIAEHRLPQDGRFRIQVGDRPIDFRVSIVPSSYGEKVALRVLDRRQMTLDIARLGFDAATLERLQQAGRRPHGMLLVTGPTGSGKTTTLYSLLKFIDEPTKNLVTVEDPVEYQMDGVNQVSVNAEIGLTFAATLRSILRQDPNIILVGEIRDGETADLAVKASLTGHLVLSTLHTNDAVGAVARLMNMGVEPFLISSSVVLVGAQRLLRQVCTACRQQVPLPKHLVSYFHLDGDREILVARGTGCTTCRGSGYYGRSAIMEILQLDATVRGLVTTGAKEQAIRAHARQAGMQTLRELAVRKMLDGVTTPDEALRVTVGV